MATPKKPIKVKLNSADKVDTDLPPGVTPADTAYGAAGTSLSYSTLREMGLDFDSGWSGRLEFYKTARFGWVITTLPISGGKPPRTYGVTLDGKIVTVGRGPHVLKVVDVYLTTDNVGRFAKFLDTWRKGMADAGSIRDRISSRRAQGQINRANGLSSWRW